MTTGGIIQVRTTLFSETDKHGIILFANEAFCKTSQYKKEELIGKSHSIVRHPDMPKKLFVMLWETVTKGETFKAIIKNKAKDGSHYWVQATIMPIVDSNQEIIKHISVRHLIEDEAVAQKLYDQQIMEIKVMAKPGF